jgi:alpha-mannosidase
VGPAALEWLNNDRGNNMTDQAHMLLVPHTHWDREWYLTFQQFRMRLVRTVDMVLEVLESDPSFTHFMLDGQTIVLEDYLEIRPDHAERLRSLARAGRLLVGPWYLQPDEFLVGGESLIRNLQMGMRMAEPYGGAMPIGYVPDTFGHIGQLPQILRGFGLDNAVFWRGVPQEVKAGPFRWRAPDGSEVLVIWLCDEFGYSNAAHIPLEPEALTLRLTQIANRMRKQGSYETLLGMNGSDHLDPQAGLPEALTTAASRLREHGLDVAIGTLPQYVALVREAQPDVPEYSGEMRSSYSAHLLPGVLSTRMWLKQRNAAVESLLTRWAEPACGWAWLLGDTYPASLLTLSWKFLLHNHPHDSICGCGIDQVHLEMMPRFDQSEQIGQELTKRALDYLTARVDTRGPEDAIPFVVFNPGAGPRTDAVRCDAQIPFSSFDVVDAEGHSLPYQALSAHAQQLFDQEVDKNLVLAGLGMVAEGRAMGYVLVDARLGVSTTTPGTALVEVSISDHGKPDLVKLERAKAQVLELAMREDITTFRVIAREAKRTELLIQARDVPARGGRVLFITPRDGGTDEAAGRSYTVDSRTRAGEDWLENAHLRIEVDRETGTLTLRDKRTGSEYAGLNQIVDGGDVGDLYTYCPPASDEVVTRPSQAPRIELRESGPVRATLRVERRYMLAEECAADRSARAPQRVEYVVVSDISLVAGAQRVEITTTVENMARDHRLRVLFPVPFVATCAEAEGVFEVTKRPAQGQKPSAEAEAWAELPVDTHPHKRFVDVHDGSRGLAVLSRGLPEYEIVAGADGPSSAVALTLLRCVGWLSREDLSTRRGHAGPMLSTPEAQGIGTHVFHYALAPHAGSWESEDALVAREAEAFEEPLRACATEQHGGALPNLWSFVHVAPQNILISAVKRAERGDGLVVRLYNPTEADVSTGVILARPFDEVVETNLNEEALQSGQPRDLARILTTGVHLTMRAGAIRTLLFRGGERGA